MTTPTPEQVREAREWLKRAPPGEGQQKAATILALLDAPRMPEEPTQELIDVMGTAHRRASLTLHNAGMWSAYRALRDHLSRPATRTVWRATWTTPGTEGQGGDHDTPEAALADARRAAGPDAVITLTPHTRAA